MLVTLEIPSQELTHTRERSVVCSYFELSPITESRVPRFPRDVLRQTSGSAAPSISFPKRTYDGIFAALVC